jgi:large subunit ribosomal protein L32
MSLTINLGRLAGLTFPRLPEIRVVIPNPFASSTATTEVSSDLQQRLQDYLDNRPVEESFFIDNGLLRAVPKKKVTYNRKRQRQLKPTLKQLPYLHHLNRCPSCGHTKRANTLCMHCVMQIKNLWKEDLKASNPAEVYEQELDATDKRILYPGKRQTEHEKQLEKKEYVERRTRSLPLSRK